MQLWVLATVSAQFMKVQFIILRVVIFQDKIPKSPISSPFLKTSSHLSQVAQNAGSAFRHQTNVFKPSLPQTTQKYCILLELFVRICWITYLEFCIKKTPV